MRVSIVILFLLFAACQQRNRSQHNTHKRFGGGIEQRVPDKPNKTDQDKRAGVERKSRHVHTDDRKSIEGKVIKISDGDTFTLLLDNDFDTKVRLNGIDCPERKQAFSQRATEELSDLIFDREVTVYYDKKDGFGRVLGDVYVGRTNVNHEMVRRGMAWHYVKYSDDEKLERLEKEARSKRVGLWSEPNPIPPWDYRRK